MKNQMKEMARISQMVFDAEMAALSRINVLQEEQEARKQALTDAARARDDQIAGADAPDAALMAGADKSWKIWQQQQQRDILAAQARIMAQRESQLVKTRRAFGRRDVLGKLSKD
jgi:ribosomal protein L9